MGYYAPTQVLTTFIKRRQYVGRNYYRNYGDGR
nr:MAG TPA: hypothetical protein [Caudoviricetes sp.]